MTDAQLMRLCGVLLLLDKVKHHCHKNPFALAAIREAKQTIELIINQEGKDG